MYSVEEIKSKRDQRVELVKQAQDLLKEADNGIMNKENDEKFDRIMEDCDALEKAARNMERSNAADVSLNTRIEVKAGRENITKGEAERDVKKVDMALDRYVRFGRSRMTEEDVSMLEPGNIQMAQSVGTTTAGGFSVPEDSSMMSTIESALLAHGGMREGATILRTGNGQDLPMPTDNDTAQTGELLAENGGSTAQDITFGQLVLNAYMYSSKRVLASRQLLQDTAIGMDAFIGEKLGTRIARITNTHLTTGDGTAKPNGIVTASSLGKTGAAGQVASFIYDDLVDLEHSVDRDYRPGAMWMMNDATLKAAKKLVDGDSRPLWMAGVAVGAPDTLLGYRYIINNDVAVMAASAKSILFGAISKYLIRDVLGMTLLRLEELYAENLQVGFLAFSRHDGDLLDAGTKPVKHYINAAV